MKTNPRKRLDGPGRTSIRSSNNYSCAQKQKYRIEVGTSSRWINSDFNLNDATEWCEANCSGWNADYYWKNSVQNYIWLFGFEDESDKVKFILRWA